MELIRRRQRWRNWSIQEDGEDEHIVIEEEVENKLRLENDYRKRNIKRLSKLEIKSYS